MVICGLIAETKGKLIDTPKNVYISIHSINNITENIVYLKVMENLLVLVETWSIFNFAETSVGRIKWNFLGETGIRYHFRPQCVPRKKIYF